jgi:YidC/Oxa1 family membrane protein insertase
VNNDNRNMIMAVVLSMLVLIGWTFLSSYIAPVANKPTVAYKGGKEVALPQPQAGPAADTPMAVRARAVVLAESPRLAIETPRLHGSISLKGGRIDDLVLTDYKQTLAKNSPPVRLLSPGGTPDAYFAGFGWTGQGVQAPDDKSVWTASSRVLTPSAPVTLSWDNGKGQRFLVTLAVDDHYMFTVTQRVVNASASAAALTPWALVSRTGISKDPTTWTIHTGPIGTFNGITDYSVDFKELAGGGSSPRFASTGGWIGFTDKYWLTAIAPDPHAAINAGFRGAEGDRYQADVALPAQLVPPGGTVTSTTRLFAGAKEVYLLRDYEDRLGIVRLSHAIDWGWFYYIEEPIFYLLHWLFRMVGNFGVAIILLTIIVRGAMFPIAQRQFVSMGKMRTLQPRMKALQEQHKNDKAKLQQEMMAMYQREKINPIGGCLPIFLQIPIFYALYKVLMLTTEMRHQPFALWIKDLSAPDPLTPVNLFGLLPFTPPHMIAIGVLPILLGITMYVQQKLNPAPMDETQKQVFAIMPWLFMFIMAPFAAGLQLYWTVSNLLTIAQQKWLYSRDPSLKPAK